MFNAMTKIFIIFIFILSTLKGLSQETLLVTERFNDSKQISESFYVLKSDKKTKHGDYTSYFKLTDQEYKNFKKGTLNIENYVRQRGQYKNGKKDGQWIEYSQPYVLRIEGKYVADKKVGIWLTYKEKGNVIEKFDNDSNKSLEPEIRISVDYPISAQRLRLEGTVIVTFNISSDCVVSNIVVTEGLSTDCDNETINAIKRYGLLLKKYGHNCRQRIETHGMKFSFE